MDDIAGRSAPRSGVAGCSALLELLEAAEEKNRCMAQKAKVLLRKARAAQ